MTRIGSSFHRAVAKQACSVAVLLALTLAMTALGGTGGGGDEREALPIGASGTGGPASAGGLGSPSTFRTVVSLGVVVALIVAGGLGLRMLARLGLGKSLGAGVGAPSGVVEILARYPAGRGLTLVVLKIDRRVLLLSQVASTTGRVDSVNTLTTFDDADDVASLLMKTQDEQGHSLSAKFREVLSGFHTRPGEHAEDGHDDAHVRTATHTGDGDEVSLINEQAAGQSLGAFRRHVSTLRTNGGGA